MKYRAVIISNDKMRINNILQFSEEFFLPQNVILKLASTPDL